MPLLVTAGLAFITFLPGARQAAQAPDVTTKARAVLSAMTAGQFTKVEDLFDDNMKVAMPSGRLATRWATLVKQLGGLKQCAAETRIRAIADKQMAITTCDFVRAAVDVQFAFDPSGRISGMAMRPVPPSRSDYVTPSYANPAAYIETELRTGVSASAPPATLTMPAGDGPFPVVVLVHGSGWHDRDETIGPNKPFKDLASGLATRGVAVLRYEKRGKPGAVTASGAGYTVQQEVLDDVSEAVKILRRQPKVAPSRIFVLGHSLGGMLVPRIGAADPSIAGLIVMAGAARPLEDAIPAQIRYLAMADGAISADEQTQIDDAVSLSARVRGLKSEDAASDGLLYGKPPSYWLDLRGYDPPTAAARLKMSMLILQGERDYQVTMEEFAKWKSALAAQRNVTFRSYPALNHLFIAGTGLSLPIEYDRPGHIAEEVIRDIATWVLTSAR